MEGYNDPETFMSDLNTLIYGHKIKMAALFAQRDVVSKMLQEQLTLCDSLAELLGSIYKLALFINGAAPFISNMRKSKF